MLASEIKKIVREVPDFPRPGINFYDVTTLFRNAQAFGSVVDGIVERFRGERIDAIASIEARGFVLGAAVAHGLEVGLILARKSGKLPYATECETYTLEYGQASLEVHRDAVGENQQILVVDDVLATGGTAAAVGRIIARLGAQVVGYAFLLELDSLGGRKALGQTPVFSLVHYA
jgi:adenine phosphoribosyltransferase